MEPTTETLRAEIADILKSADLNTITAKAVRLQIEEKLNIELIDRKKEIDGLVMDFLDMNKHYDGGMKRGREADGSEDDWAKKKRLEDDWARANVAPAKPAKKGGTGYTKTCKLSPELALVMGEENMARHEVVKRMWKIIKEQNLYDPKNKQYAICNDDLMPVFGVKRFRTFGMMKYLKTHFIS